MPPRELVLLAGLMTALTGCGNGPEPTAGDTPAGPVVTASTLPPVISLAPTEDLSDDDMLLVEVQVIEVEDGDSLRVVLDGVTERVRLRGINAPEDDECLGDESREALAGLVGDAAVLGLEREERDRFGRILGHVFVDDGYVNRRLVSEGLAIALSETSAFKTELIDAEEEAERNGVGLWSASSCGGGPFPENLEIVRIEPDPPGRDEENLGEEFIVIANGSDAAVDLRGFVVRDESTANRYVFEPGFVLGPGLEVRLVSGCSPPRGDLGWCAGGPVWNNGGDSAILLDAAGRVIDHVRYDG